MPVYQLARDAGMNVSSFHYWFRTITGMSPLKYQNKFRLQEARTIRRNGKLAVGSVSRRVGYESSSQFSREYSRLFGTPLVREISKPRSAN
jgi:AraC-like DNA-binding protein